MLDPTKYGADVVSKVACRDVGHDCIVASLLRQPSISTLSRSRNSAGFEHDVIFSTGRMISSCHCCIAQLLVRQLDEDVKDALQRRARAHGRSTEEEVREILCDRCGQDRRDRFGLGRRSRLGSAARESNATSPSSAATLGKGRTFRIHDPA